MMKKMHRLKPDVVFLDIEMPNMNGFDMLEKIEYMNFDVVFCTAYDQFAIKAFKYSALDYLLKPVDPEDLKTTIKRVKEKNVPASAQQFDLLFKTLQENNKQTPPRIALTTGDGLIFVNTGEIIYCEAASNYTQVILTEGRKVLVSKVLKDIDEVLSGPDFYRFMERFEKF
jgi:two-component system LytT family response regulator